MKFYLKIGDLLIHTILKSRFEKEQQNDEEDSGVEKNVFKKM